MLAIHADFRVRLDMPNLTMNVGFRGLRGSGSDVAKLTRLTHLRHGLHLAFGARRRLDVQNELDA
jgi:hypothetical protein